ncbi:hypothetical protein, partial [Candidatus Frankia nodulisporulans]|uniref:hypothetical protein n=1 Tax=Candidatus Frankia nodulisporulans TaxID=2060052 RepID=UPI001CDCD732
PIHDQEPPVVAWVLPLSPVEPVNNPLESVVDPLDVVSVLVPELELVVSEVVVLAPVFTVESLAEFEVSASVAVAVECSCASTPNPIMPAVARAAIPAVIGPVCRSPCSRVATASLPASALPNGVHDDHTGR